MKKMLKIAFPMAAFALLVLAGNVHAAADTQLTSAIASSTGFFSDNLAVIMTFVIENVLKLAGAILGLLSIYWIIRKIRSLFKK